MVGRNNTGETVCVTSGVGKDLEAANRWTQQHVGSDVKQDCTVTFIHIFQNL